MVAPLINRLSQSSDDVSVYWHDERLPNKLFNSDVKLILASSLSDADFARRVRSDKIDAMVDICGMRVGSRQRSLGLHLCNQQLGWLAHEGLYASPLITPIEAKFGAQRYFIAGEINKAKQARNSFNNTFVGIGAKQGLAYDVIKTWAYILHQVKDWRLLIDTANNHIVKVLKQRFSALGINSERLIFDNNPEINQGSIVLDNFIANEPVSACSAIEAGGVLVALKGPLFPAQHTAALLSQVGRVDWLCESRIDYANKAIYLTQQNSDEFTPVSSTELEACGVRDIESFANHFRSIITN